MRWTPKNIIGILLLLFSFYLWLTAISGATAAGFFEDELSLQLMVLGGAVSMVAGAIWALW